MRASGRYLPMQTQLTEADHDAGVHHVRRVRGCLALDAAIRPEVVLVDLRVNVARERLENLKKKRTPVTTHGVTIPHARYIEAVRFLSSPKAFHLRQLQH